MNNYSKLKIDLFENQDYYYDWINIRSYRSSDYKPTLEILKQLNELYGVGINVRKWEKTSGLRSFRPNLNRKTLIAESKTLPMSRSMLAYSYENTLELYLLGVT